MNMKKYRTTGPDVMPPKRKKNVDKGVDALPDHRIPIYDHEGNMRGHVGHKATAATVSRFIGQHGAKLGKKDGRDAWIAPDRNVTGGHGSVAAIPLEKSVRAARGSVRS